MRVFLAVLMCGVTPAWAAAQSVAATLPDNDAIIAIGWAGAEHKIHDDRQWHGSLLVGVSGGHYWTDHLKTEVDANWNTSAGMRSIENIARDGGYTYALSDYRAHDTRIGVVQLYQFGRNEWVHPYIGVGADVVRRTRIARATAPVEDRVRAAEPEYSCRDSGGQRAQDDRLRARGPEDGSEDVRQRKSVLQHRGQVRCAARRRSLRVEDRNGHRFLTEENNAAIHNVDRRDVRARAGPRARGAGNRRSIARRDTGTRMRRSCRLGQRCGCGRRTASVTPRFWRWSIATASQWS